MIESTTVTKSAFCHDLCQRRHKPVQVVAIVMKASQTLAELGATVEEISVPAHATSRLAASAIALPGIYATCFEACDIGRKGVHLTSMSARALEGVKDNKLHLVRDSCLCISMTEYSSQR